MPEFAHPQLLWLLAGLPLLAWLRRRGGVPEGPLRRIMGSALRLLGFILLVLALAGPLAPNQTADTDVIVALDRSRSISNEAESLGASVVSRLLSEHPDTTRVGLLVFGAEAAVEHLPGASADAWPQITSHVERAGTDIAGAIETAAAAFDTRGHRRIVLVSDGRENQGDARAAAAVARSIGIQVDTITLSRPPAGAEVAVLGLSAPEQVRAHEPFRLTVNLHSRDPARAQLLLLRNGTVVEERTLELRRGDNAATFAQQVPRAGLSEYEAVVNAERDADPENNRFQTFVQVAGPPRILHAVDDAARAAPLAAALEAQGFTVDRVPATSIPAALHRLTDHDLLVLDDVSGFDLSVAKMELLESYVRDAGGGLLKIGGDRSYAAGGYYDTPVERMLPVTMDVKTTVKIPSLAVIFVLDRSGSMGSRTQGEEKITIAKNAALSSIELLNPLDRVGVLAFDDGVEWVVEPTEVANRRPIALRLRELGAGGSTNLVGALEEAVKVMSQQKAKVKHLIVLSDGLTGSDADFSGIAADIDTHAITVSTVALGIDADRRLMADLASVGGGRFYATDDPRNVPRIFTSETMVVSRNLVVEGTTAARLKDSAEPLAGFGADAFPAVEGYQRAFAKPAAQVLLAAADDDPLLATWRYGLGKSAAFTSDLTNRWGRRWVDWPDYTRFVSQLARWTMRRRGNETFRPRFVVRDAEAELVVDVLDRDERFINGLALNAAVRTPDKSTRTIALTQVAPGRYQGRFAVTREGRYYATLEGATLEGATPEGAAAAGEARSIRVGPRTFGLAVPYSSEFRDLGPDPALMEDVAAATGGRVLRADSASIRAALAPGTATLAARDRIWQPLLIAALIVLLLEVAVRKVVLPQAWLDRFVRARAEAEPEPEYEELRRQMNEARERHLRALRGSRARTRRDGIRHVPDDPASRARLYLSRKR